MGRALLLLRTKSMESKRTHSLRPSGGELVQDPKSYLASLQSLQDLGQTCQQRAKARLSNMQMRTTGKQLAGSTSGVSAAKLPQLLNTPQKPNRRSEVFATTPHRQVPSTLPATCQKPNRRSEVFATTPHRQVPSTLPAACHQSRNQVIQLPTMPPLPACLLKNDASNCKLLSQLRRDGDAYLVGHGEEVLSPRERAARRKQELRTKRPGPLTLGGPARPVVF